MPKAAGRWNQRLGRAAEELAACHLRRRGCRLLARRYRWRGGEVDLIVRDRDTIAFVEVKARRSSRYGSPLEAVTRDKQVRVRAAAAHFLRRRRATEAAVRFDVVAVYSSAGHARVEWVRDAF